jgi:hypothetical protein
MKTHTGILHMKLPPEMLVRWKKAADKARLSLSAFVRACVDKQAVR